MADLCQDFPRSDFSGFHTNAKEKKLKAQNREGLRFGNFEAVSSNENDFIQIVDLFTGAVNRKLHPQQNRNHKDEFANFVVELTGLNLEGFDENNTDADSAVLFNLR